MAEVVITEDKRYLLRIDGEIICIIDDEIDAIKAVNSIATAEEKKRATPKRTIFRRTIRDGREIEIYSQPMRIMFTAMVKEMTIDLLPVTLLVFTSPYADKIAKFKAEKAKIVTEDPKIEM